VDVVALVLGQVAHDLRTPLGSLALWLHQLREDCADTDLSVRILSMVEGGARALTRFARDLDDAAQILRGTLQLQNRPVELRGLLEGIVAALGPRAEAKGVTMRGALGADRVMVAGDSERLCRGLDALVEAALAGARGGSAVAIRLEVDDRHAVVAISPSPVGPEGLPRLRERLGPAPGRGGLGLPLALARHHLEAHEARIEIGSDEIRVRLALSLG
jgi:two-component system phosphate regulon sensor histidine kinase PhoR